jgi:YidC/Oxa1 family membrane protein insertase
MDFLLNPFVTVLTLLYQLLGNNIVLAIVALTVIIRLLTSPLLLQQQKSAEAMSVLQPQIKKMQEKYKGDREKISQAQMELYREHGINPLGGCLPLLVQLPILFALYGAIIYGLGSTPFQVVDLSGRLLLPGLDSLVPLDKFWLGLDLTQPPKFDAGGVAMALAIALPILTMVTTWLQSKLTMPPTDPNDKSNPAAGMTRSMTTIMPLMYGFFALSFSVGISIYFIVSNLVGIVQYTLLGKAHWDQVLGPRFKTAAKKSKELTPEQQAKQDAVLAKVSAKIESMPRNPALGSGTGRASQDILKARPGSASTEKSGAGGKKKKK